MSAASSTVKGHDAGSLGLRRKNKFIILPFLLLTPTMILLAVFTFYPFIRSISLLSMQLIGRAGTFVGLRIWKRYCFPMNSNIACADVQMWMHRSRTFALAMFLSYISIK